MINCLDFQGTAYKSIDANSQVETNKFKEFDFVGWRSLVKLVKKLCIITFSTMYGGNVILYHKVLLSVHKVSLSVHKVYLIVNKVSIKCCKVSTTRLVSLRRRSSGAGKVAQCNFLNTDFFYKLTNIIDPYSNKNCRWITSKH